MRRKVFRGRDLREALSRVRRALGPDAVIFSTRRVEPGEELAGLFDEPYFEVEAAEWPALEELAAGEGAASAPGLDDAPPGRAAGPPAAGRADPRGTARRALLAELCRSGMSQVAAEEILARAADALPAGEAEAAAVLRARLAEILALLFEVAGPIRAPRTGGGPAVANFIGPTGAGKTTTIAKIAAASTAQRRWKVGLIGVDSGRVGAVETLRAHAAALRLPFLAVKGAAELDAALRRFRGADLVLVDTDGCAPGDSARLAELARLFGEGRPGGNYLVLAANTHPEDMARMGERFARVPLNGLVFTKLDESSRFGVIFERHMELGVPVAYFTAGRRIPQDLEVATAPRMARLILPKSPVPAVAGASV